MTTLRKIQFISYFCIGYALLQLLSVLGLIGQEDNLPLIRGVVNVLIWSYLAYALLKKRDKWTYLLALIFIGLLVVRGFVGTALIILSGNSLIDLITYDPMLFSIAGLVTLLATVMLLILIKKDARAIFIK